MSYTYVKGIDAKEWIINDKDYVPFIIVTFLSGKKVTHSGLQMSWVVYES
jgi:hypothetical protein